MNKKANKSKQKICIIVELLPNVSIGTKWIFQNKNYRQHWLWKRMLALKEMSHSHIISKQRIKKLLRGGDQKTNKKRYYISPNTVIVRISGIFMLCLIEREKRRLLRWYQLFSIHLKTKIEGTRLTLTKEQTRIQNCMSTMLTVIQIQSLEKQTGSENFK